MARKNTDDDDDDTGDDAPPVAESPEEGRFDPDQMEQIKAGVNALAWFKWPSDPDVKACIKPLTREEMYRGAAQAKEYIDEIGLTGEVYEEVMRTDGTTVKVMWTELAKRDEWLTFAIRDGDDPSVPLFANANDLRAKLMPEEVTRLYEMLGDHMQRVMPLTTAQKLGDEEQYLKLLQYLKKQPGSMELASLPPSILRALLIFTIEKLVP